MEIRERFRSTFPSSFLAIFVVALALVLAYYRLDLNLAKIPRLLISLAVFSAIGTLVLILVYKVQVGPQGLRSYDIWGMYHTVHWSNVIEARPINLLGLKYIRVYTARGGRSLWVPIFLKERDRFAVVVREYAGEVNPLTRAFNEMR